MKFQHLPNQALIVFSTVLRLQTCVYFNKLVYLRQMCDHTNALTKRQLHYFMPYNHMKIYACQKFFLFSTCE